MRTMLLPFRRYFDFSGRSGRAEFWNFMLFTLLVYAVVGGITMSVFINNAGHDMNGAAASTSLIGVAGFAVLGVFWLLTLIPTIAVQVRRLHDQDKSGWFMLLTFVPYVGGLILLILMMLAGTQGPNRYGPDTRASYNAEVFA